MTVRERLSAQERGRSVVGLPVRQVSPFRSVLRRAGFAFALILVSAAIVYAGRTGYRDSAHPSRPVSFLDAVYYSTVTLTTTGYGDIVPVTTPSRLVNTLVITPLRIAFLITLVGTTLSVLAERTRTGWRVARWRSRVTGHTIVVGFGTKGKAAVDALTDNGVIPTAIVVVDEQVASVREANLAGLTAVHGDATRRDVLGQAETGKASRVVITVPRDDTAVLITLTARQLNPDAVIVATIRETENESLLRRSGANHVIVSAEAAGRLVGLTAVDSAVGEVLASVLSCEGGIELADRAVATEEVGRSAQSVAGDVVAVVRGGTALAPADPRLGVLAPGDRLVLSTPPPAADVG